MNTFACRLSDVVVVAAERVVLDDITLEIAVGERIAIVGHNGAGKSTLLKLLTGAIQPRHGKVVLLGRDMSESLARRELRELRSQVGQVFQGLHLVQRLTALENVLLGSLSRNRSWLTWARLFPASEVMRAEESLRKVGLIGKAQVRADRLSGGERQKTAIARMLMQSAQLVLADEPTAALDPVASADIANLLASLAKQRKTTLVSVVHDPGVLPLLADRVIGLRHGRIVFDLPAAEVDDDVLGRLYRDPSSAGWLARLQQTDALVEKGENA